MALRVAFSTLGCKLNQLETDAMADAFARAGAVVLPFEGGPGGAADLVVINTCTVTAKAERKARRLARLALASSPEAVLLVTGCYAQVEAEALAALGDRVIVLPGGAKDAMLGLPGLLGAGAAGPAALYASLREALAPGSGADARGASGIDGRFAYNPASFAFHSRPSLKVQDGCDNECAYCRVRVARGPSASLPSAEVLSRARGLERAGRAEIVLTGVNLSQYEDGDVDFPGLLRILLAGTETIAFRLSSYEPDRVDSSFLEAFAHPRIRPHLHLALQSGSDSVLGAMGRHYRGQDAIEAVEALRRAKGDPFLAADLISGFPGEAESDAEATLALARGCDFAWIHAFRFSPRPGTKAASLPGRVPERVASARAEALFELAREGRARYLDRWRGRELRAILEDGLGATSDNYLKLKVAGLPESARPGQEIVCRLEGSPPGRTEAPGFADIDAFASYRNP
jgi:threonylcarbamoyladenosine tRNA methylthiotransferase MtaB